MIAAWVALLFLILGSSDDSSYDNNEVIITLAATVVIVLVICGVINVCLVVKLKQSRCVVLLRYWHSLWWYTYAWLCCRSRYDVSHDQSNVSYNEVKQSLSRDNTITVKKSSEPEYEAIETDPKLGGDVKMVANPAYKATS